MSFLKIQLFLFISALFLHKTLGGGGAPKGEEVITCKHLTSRECAYAIGADGKRCILDKKEASDGGADFRCSSSEVIAADYKSYNCPETSITHEGYLETEKCIQACGLARETLGMSSDALLDPKFTLKLCSSECSQNCPNIIDLYKNLAAGEGAFLPSICEALNNIPQRSMVELLSSGGVLGGGGGQAGSAPSPAPSPQ